VDEPLLMPVLQNAQPLQTASPYAARVGYDENIRLVESSFFETSGPFTRIGEIAVIIVRTVCVELGVPYPHVLGQPDQSPVMGPLLVGHRLIDDGNDRGPVLLQPPGDRQSHDQNQKDQE